MIRPLSFIPLALIVIASYGPTAHAQYTARPVIVSLDPSSGPPQSRVKINGRNFSDDYKVYFNGIELKLISLEPNEIVVQLPQNATQGRFTLRGTVHQVVSPQVFWVVQPKVSPIISKIAPESGPPETLVTITGKHFSSNSHENTVSVGGAPAQIRNSSVTRIEAIVPAGAKTGHVVVQVYNAGQTTSQQTFEVLPLLKISSFEPPFASPGAQVTLVGSGFSSNPQANNVSLGEVKCKVIRATSEEMVVQIPRNGAESSRFSITVKNLGTTESPTAFRVAQPPVITDFSPKAGGKGQEITLTGTHFGDNPKLTQVLLTGRACNILSIEDKKITIQVPVGAVSGPLEVIVDKMGSAVSKQGFEVWAPLAVTKMDPLYGLPGTEVQIFGSGFRTDPRDHTLIIGSKVLKIDRIENGALIFKIPQDAPDGEISLRLEVKERGATMIAMPLNVAHMPEITDFSPKRGPVGTNVTVSGKYFGTKTKHIRVIMGNQTVNVTAVTPNAVQFPIPPGATTDYIEVKTVRRGNAKSAKKFDVYLPVTITNFIPSAGHAGQVISIFGSGFEASRNKNNVTMGTKTLKVVEASPSKLKVKLPKDLDSNPIRVEVPQRGSSQTARSFNVIPKLEIKNFSPSKGVPGTYVVVKGKGFSNRGLLGYLGQSPIGVRVDSPEQVTIGVPQGAQNGPFVFTAPGAGQAASKQTFEVLTPLTITSFQPTSGQEGTKVSIYGSGFNPSPKKTKVLFGSNTLNIEPGSSDTMLIVTIPKKSQEAPFKITVRDRGEVESENVFAVVQPTPTTAPAAPPVTVAAAAKPLPAAPTPAPAPPQPKPAATAPTPAAPTPTPTDPVQKPPSAGKSKSMDDLMGIQKIEVTSFDPTSGQVGDVITIVGNGFGEDPGAVKAWIRPSPGHGSGRGSRYGHDRNPRGGQSGQNSHKSGWKSNGCVKGNAKNYRLTSTSQATVPAPPRSPKSHFCLRVPRTSPA